MTDTGVFALSWDNHKINRTQELKAFVENEEFTDVTLACDDHEIKVHKVIISTASPLLHKIFKRSSHKHPYIYLRGAKKKDLENLVTFIYIGQASIYMEDLQSFLDLARDLEVKGLVYEEKGLTETIKQDQSFQKDDFQEMRLIHVNNSVQVEIKEEDIKIMLSMLKLICILLWKMNIKKMSKNHMKYLFRMN